MPVFPPGDAYLLAVKRYRYFRSLLLLCELYNSSHYPCFSYKAALLPKTDISYIILSLSLGGTFVSINAQI